MDLIKVTSAKYLEGYKLEIFFNNGERKIIDLEDQLWGEVFEPLKDKEYFRNFRLNDFTVEWQNGADFAPEFLYHMEDAEIEKER